LILEGFLEGLVTGFASEMHLGLDKQGSHDYRVIGFKVDWYQMKKNSKCKWDGCTLRVHSFNTRYSRYYDLHESVKSKEIKK
jgi:hypothetical protein